MIVERVFDKERIAEVLLDPEMFERIAEEGITASDYQIPDEAIYVMDGENKGLMIYHWVNSVTLECHVHVLKEFRHEAMEFGQKALQWAWDNTEALKIVAQIPEIYPDVVKFAFKNGFELEGLNESSYLKNSRLYSQVYLGLRRDGLC